MFQVRIKPLLLLIRSSETLRSFVIKVTLWVYFFGCLLSSWFILGHVLCPAGWRLPPCEGGPRWPRSWPPPAADRALPRTVMAEGIRTNDAMKTCHTAAGGRNDDSTVRDIISGEREWGSCKYVCYVYRASIKYEVILQKSQDIQFLYKRKADLRDPEQESLVMGTHLLVCRTLWSLVVPLPLSACRCWWAALCSPEEKYFSVPMSQKRGMAERRALWP